MKGFFFSLFLILQLLITQNTPKLIKGKTLFIVGLFPTEV